MPGMYPQNVPRNTFVMKNCLKAVQAVKFSTFCCVFTLRQGTITIAIIDLSLTSFCMFLLLLATTHAQDIVSLVTSELKELQTIQRGGGDVFIGYVLSNEVKMLTGQELAFTIMMIIWLSLLIAGVYFISCVLLLYGAIKNSPRFLLPWTTTSILNLVSGSFYFVIVIGLAPVETCKLALLLLFSLFSTVELYAWFTVFSFYRDLKAQQLKNGTLYCGKETGAFSQIEIHHQTC